jgi:hypothetical protein
MKLHYFFGCILAAASLVVWPEIGLAHGGGGGRGGGGGGSHFVGTHFTARSGNRFDRHFHNRNGDVVIFDQLDYGSYYDLSTDGTVYQGRPDRRLFLHRLRNGHGDPGDRRLRTAY